MSLPHQLLILDSFSGHLSSNFKQRTKAENIPIAVIPGGLTKECQPLDIGINRSFKAQFRKLWTRWVERLDLPSTEGGKIKAIEIDDLAHLVRDAWENVPADSIINSFKSAHLSLQKSSICNCSNYAFNET
jgi:hypothetical protein